MPAGRLSRRSRNPQTAGASHSPKNRVRFASSSAASAVIPRYGKCPALSTWSSRSPASALYTANWPGGGTAGSNSAAATSVGSSSRVAAVAASK